MLFCRLGRSYCKQRVLWRKLKFQRIVTFHCLSCAVSHWLSCYKVRRSLFFLLLKNRLVARPVFNARYLFSSWSLWCALSGRCVRVLSSSLPAKWGFCLLIFTMFLWFFSTFLPDFLLNFSIVFFNFQELLIGLWRFAFTAVGSLFLCYNRYTILINLFEDNYYNSYKFCHMLSKPDSFDGERGVKVTVKKTQCLCFVYQNKWKATI